VARWSMRLLRSRLLSWPALPRNLVHTR
jgi:hypothetical protein